MRQDLDIQLIQAERDRAPDEGIYWYEVDVPTICGVVRARSRDEAQFRAAEHAYALSPAYIDAGTWSLREVTG